MVAKSLKDLRIMRNLEPKDVADRVGVTESYIYMLEQGVRNPSDKMKLRLAIVYDVSPSDIFLLCQSTLCKSAVS